MMLVAAGNILNVVVVMLKSLITSSSTFDNWENIATHGHILSINGMLCTSKHSEKETEAVQRRRAELECLMSDGSCRTQPNRVRLPSISSMFFPHFTWC